MPVGLAVVVVVAAAAAAVMVTSTVPGISGESTKRTVVASVVAWVVK